MKDPAMASKFAPRSAAAAANAPARPPMPRALVPAAALLAALMAGLLLWLWGHVPQKDGVRDLYGQLFPGSWMAWSFPVALFFWTIAAILMVMTCLAIAFPEEPRRGILGLATTRGDRLFISLLGAAFICLIWLFFMGPPVWWGLVIGAVWAIFIFTLG